jgi:hypothetical protein
VIERDFEKVSLRQLFRLISARSVRSWIVIGSIVLTVLEALGGIGYKAGEFWLERDTATERPQALSITRAIEASAGPTSVVTELANTMLTSHTATPGNKLWAVLLQSSDFEKPTPNFSIEVSHKDRSIIAAYALRRTEAPGGEELTILPVQKRNHAVRALVSRSSRGTRVMFLVLLEDPSAVDASQILQGFVLRSLE